jgi:hypothetical protein
MNPATIIVDGAVMSRPEEDQPAPLCVRCNDVGYVEEGCAGESDFRLCPATGCAAAQEAFDALKEDSDGLY